MLQSSKFRAPLEAQVCIEGVLYEPDLERKADRRWTGQMEQPMEDDIRTWTTKETMKIKEG